MANTKILVDDVTDASHFGAKEQVFMETPEFPRADREEVFRILATDYRDGSISNEEFKTLYEDRPGIRVLFIRCGRMDPYEHAQITSNTYYDWMFRHIYLLVPAQALVGEFLATFKEFPPRQKAASFSLDQVVEKMTEASKAA